MIISISSQTWHLVVRALLSTTYLCVTHLFHQASISSALEGIGINMTHISCQTKDDSVEIGTWEIVGRFESLRNIVLSKALQFDKTINVRFLYKYICILVLDL